MSNPLLQKPKDKALASAMGRYEKFKLQENPFPTEPVNKDSFDRRINGSIFSMEIRQAEYQQIEDVFLKQPQSTLSRQRMGFIKDTSYIGRGNGKSAFLVNLMNKINSDFCLDISDGANKCFAAYVVPEGGGRTKSFYSFVDLIFDALCRSGIISTALASIRLEALQSINPVVFSQLIKEDTKTIIERMNSEQWLKKNDVDIVALALDFSTNDKLQALPEMFPLFTGGNTLFPEFVKSEHFEKYYAFELKAGRDRLDFVFSHLVQFFIGAGFNGAYLLVDDFERIPDFQSGRQKRDFAVELRSFLLDGMSISARTGFYNLFLVLHAGVPELIRDAWSLSGLENRYPLDPNVRGRHIIPFEKLNHDHVLILFKTYIHAYRTEGGAPSDIYPFTDSSIRMIGEDCEYNAGKMLRSANDLLEKAIDEGKDIIDKEFIKRCKSATGQDEDVGIDGLDNADFTDIIDKAKKGD